MLEPVMAAIMAIQLHIVAASLALLLGPLVMLRRRRDRWHRYLGYGWVLAMAVTALSSFFIFELRLIGLFSPIHLLSLLSLYTLAKAVLAARRRDIAAHLRYMRILYFSSLGIAGLFTLLPGRIMSEILFARPSWLGFAGAGVIWVGVFALLFRRARRLG